MSRAVARRASQSHEDYAILFIDPLSQHQVHFAAIRDVANEFLLQHKRVQIWEIQKSHLGQALVRFEHIYDRDNLIAQSPHPYGDVAFSFVKHNEGRNWRSVEYNHECWLLLMGFPFDYWASNHIQNAITPFGKLLTWEDDPSNLTRLLVKARVTDLDDVLKYIIFSESEGFLGQTWTIQCEVMSQHLLGAQPQDGDVPPMDDPLDVGLGQQANLAPFFDALEPMHPELQ
jgi:hypothetical protein